MPSPTRRDGSSVHYLRKRVPADLTDRAVGLVLRIPVGDEIATVRVGDAGTIKVSLRTHHPREAKARQAKVLAYLDDVWKSLRDGPRRLSHKQVVALAGDFRQRAIARFDDEPGPATIWARLLELSVGWDEDARLQQAAPFVEEHLARHALNVDEDTKAALTREMFKVGVEIAEVLKGRAEGNYSPDNGANRFPALQLDAPKGQAAVTVAELLAGWELESRAAGVTDKTVSEYKSVLTRFVAFIEHDDATRITPHDVIRWKDKRLADGRSSKTVKDVDLSAMKSVFGWGVRNHKLPSNPAQGVTLKIGKKVNERGKGFTDDEAEAILRAALDHHGTAQEHSKMAAAKRWLPWLCAYTGARIGEVAQLRREDVRRECDHFVAKITPEAGPVKNKEAREVPLHPHLIELGFIDFVTSSTKGYLFLTLAKDDEVQGKLRTLKNRLAEFGRAIVSDKRVAPNHGWRHRFITMCRKYRLDPEKRRMITGHAGKGIDERVYGDPAGLYAEVCKLPRYLVDGCGAPLISQ
ncbi:MAG TPA: DUF6538 domain-containing protein [Nitrobacter sp.]|nr:DUF6538 domain-containing protein [Nitrobacter sp.]